MGNEMQFLNIFATIFIIFAVVVLFSPLFYVDFDCKEDSVDDLTREMLVFSSQSDTLTCYDYCMNKEVCGMLGKTGLTPEFCIEVCK